MWQDYEKGPLNLTNFQKLGLAAILTATRVAIKSDLVRAYHSTQNNRL